MQTDARLVASLVQNKARRLPATYSDGDGTKTTRQSAEQQCKWYFTRICMCLTQRRQTEHAGIYVCCSLFWSRHSRNKTGLWKSSFWFRTAPAKRNQMPASPSVSLSNLRRTQHPQMTPSTGPRPRGPDRPLSASRQSMGRQRKTQNKQSRIRVRGKGVVSGRQPKAGCKMVWCTGDGPIDPRVFFFTGSTLISPVVKSSQGNSWLCGHASSEQEKGALEAAPDCPIRS